MKILDMCCGSKMFWYEKHEPHTTYMDIRKATYTAMDRGKERKIEISPDIQADFRNMPFEDNTFDLVVFDPPHLIRKDFFNDPFYTGRDLLVEITFITDYQQKDGYVVLGTKPLKIRWIKSLSTKMEV